MLPVTPQDEPADFDAKVRQPGLKDMKARGIDPTKPLLKGTELKPCWRACLDDLHRAYNGICAYASLYIEPVTGARTVEHFKPKNPNPGDAYEWKNYRLVCQRLNSRKGTRRILDPFTLTPGTFQLNLLDGAILPNANLPAAQATIDTLNLDDGLCRADRLAYIDEYMKGDISAAHLQRRAPFVHAEMQRQGWL